MSFTAAYASAWFGAGRRRTQVTKPMVQTLERKSKFGYEPKDEIQIDEMRNPEAIREVIEEVQETKEERLVDLGKMQVYRVMWNDSWEAVQITLVRPIGSYAVPNEDGDAD